MLSTSNRLTEIASGTYESDVADSFEKYLSLCLNNNQKDKMIHDVSHIMSRVEKIASTTDPENISVQNKLLYISKTLNEIMKDSVSFGSTRMTLGAVELEKMSDRILNKIRDLDEVNSYSISVMFGLYIIMTKKLRESHSSHNPNFGKFQAKFRHMCSIGYIYLNSIISRSIMTLCKQCNKEGLFMAPTFIDCPSGQCFECQTYYYSYTDTIVEPMRSSYEKLIYTFIPSVEGVGIPTSFEDNEDIQEESKQADLEEDEETSDILSHSPPLE
jgi:hypothetical protein